MDDQYKIQKAYTPKPATRVPLQTEELENSDVKQPSEKDTRKLTIILGKLKVDPKIIPQEILEEMNNQEKDAIKKAFMGSIEEKFGNRIEIICETRQDALMLAKWKGNQRSGTYTQNPLPDCFTHITWNTTQE